MKNEKTLNNWVEWIVSTVEITERIVSEESTIGGSMDFSKYEDAVDNEEYGY